MRLFALATITLVLAGCAGSSPPASSSPPYTPFKPATTPACAVPVPGSSASEDFDGVPALWTATEGTWAAEANATAKSAPNVMRGSQADPNEAVSNLVACPLGAYSDLDLNVWFRIVAPEEDAAGAGIVIHYHDAANYQIVRFSVREAGWHLFTWTPDAPRVKQSGASVATGVFHEAGEWVRLRVVSRDGHVTAYDAGMPVIQYDLPPNHSGIGAVGLFLRSNTTADFDDFQIAAT